MKKIIILIILFFCVNVFSQKSLNGLVVIIDPGHGGCDLGAPFLSEQGKILNENAYNYDVSLRLVKLLKSNGAKVFKTTRSERTNIQDTSYLESCTKAIFSLDRSIVQSGLIGLSKRVYFSNLKRNKYS